MTLDYLPHAMVAVAAAAGGLTWFVCCWSTDKYKIKVPKKAFCDTFGGLNVGFFMSLPLSESIQNRAMVAFVLGLSWGLAAQFIREKITATILSSLGGAMRGFFVGLTQANLDLEKMGTVGDPAGVTQQGEDQ